jgi:hypothetical protein
MRKESRKGPPSRVVPRPGARAANAHQQGGLGGLGGLGGIRVTAAEAAAIARVRKALGLA